MRDVIEAILKKKPLCRLYMLAPQKRKGLKWYCVAYTENPPPPDIPESEHIAETMTITAKFKHEGDAHIYAMMLSRCPAAAHWYQIEIFRGGN